jgi:hypothetical protein
MILSNEQELKEKNNLLLHEKNKGDDLDSEDIMAYSTKDVGDDDGNGEGLESGGAIMDALAENDPSLKRAARNAKAKTAKKSKTLSKKSTKVK